MRLIWAWCDPVNDPQYTVTYYFKSGKSFELPPTGTLPDLEKDPIEEAVTMIGIASPHPLEAKLNPRCRPLASDRIEYMFPSLYFLKFQLLSYDEAVYGQEKSNVDQLRDAAVICTLENRRYFNPDDVRTPEEMNYIYLPDTQDIYVFRDNYALLEPVEENDQGILRQKVHDRDINDLKNLVL